MIRAAALAAVFLALAAAQAALRPYAASPPRGASETGASGGLVLGLLRPFVAQLLWARAETALADRRDTDAAADLRLSEAVDPDNPDAAVFRAHVVGRNLAAHASDPAARFGLVLEAVGILERAGRRTGHPLPWLELGRFLTESWAGDPDAARRFERERKETPIAAAARAFDEAVRRAAGGALARPWRILRIETWRLRGVEILARDGPEAEARAAFATSAEAAAAEAEPSEATLLSAAWRRFVDAADAGGDSEIGAATEGLVARLDALPAGGPATTSEILLAASVLPRATEIARRRLASGAAAAALSVCEAVHTIGRLAEARAGLRPPGARDGGAAATTFDSLLKSIESADPALAVRAARLRAAVK